MAAGTKSSTVKEILPVKGPDLKSFIGLERSFLGSEPRYYSVDLDSDIEKRFTGKSSLAKGIDFALFVSSAESPAARCAALINHAYQEHHKEKVGFIGYFAARPDAGTQVQEMLGRSEAWLKSQGVTRVVTSCNGSAIKGMAVLTAGFDEEPMFPFSWNPPYYRGYFEQAGYKPTYPLWSFWVDFSTQQYRDASSKALTNTACTIRPINKKQWDEELALFCRLFNEAFREEWEMHRYTIEEFQEFFGPMKPVLDPRQMLIAEVNGDPAGFCFGMPDYTPLFRSFKGQMGPIQIARFMLKANRYKRAGLLAIGVSEKHRKKGIGQTMAATLYKRFEEKGLPGAFYYVVNDVNIGSRSLAESFGGKGRVVYHCFDKSI